MDTINLNFKGTRSKRLEKSIAKIQKLLEALNERDLPEDVLNNINEEIKKINTADTESKLYEQINKSYNSILKMVEKRLNLVTKNHYLAIWMAIGMAAFGIPFGVVFGLMLENMAFMGSGIGIGLAIGLPIGAGMDKKAKEEGRQLDISM
ncbi:hypothetical protein QYS48_28755 [Marivirga arenosa]|uniref:Glycine zipper family protein n=1 Tax=Marivirga arenosa TaxID=3059076 RepID=A0AA51NAE0_9BACT|nr:hypothetical protein [Marivirga sp. ABR2-2]WMN07441.1 hypothetical protein QYS48_28755 [Marivirga sp. ABR2-2]